MKKHKSPDFSKRDSSSSSGEGSDLGPDGDQSVMDSLAKLKIYAKKSMIEDLECNIEERK
jgi:hypothetical protein